MQWHTIRRFDRNEALLMLKVDERGTQREAVVERFPADAHDA